jgi:hypothetical protein
MTLVIIAVLVFPKGKLAELFPRESGKLLIPVSMDYSQLLGWWYTKYQDHWTNSWNHDSISMLVCIHQSSWAFFSKQRLIFDAVILETSIFHMNSIKVSWVLTFASASGSCYLIAAFTFRLMQSMKSNVWLIPALLSSTALAIALVQGQTFIFIQTKCSKIWFTYIRQTMSFSMRRIINSSMIIQMTSSTMMDCHFALLLFLSISTCCKPFAQPRSSTTRKERAVFRWTKVTVRRKEKRGLRRTPNWILWDVEQLTSYGPSWRTTF